jgi:hypothetical protein
VTPSGPFISYCPLWDEVIRNFGLVAVSSLDRSQVIAITHNNASTTHNLSNPRFRFIVGSPTEIRISACRL